MEEGVGSVLDCFWKERWGGVCTCAGLLWERRNGGGGMCWLLSERYRWGSVLDCSRKERLRRRRVCAGVLS